MSNTFCHDTHRYAIGGSTVPSVTQVISATVQRPFNPGDWYLQRGRAIHHAIHLMAKGTLDWQSVDPRILPRVQAVKRFLSETGFQIAESEVQLFSERLRFAGTVDAVLTGDSGMHLILTDFKSSIEPQVEIQLGGYSILMKENRPKQKAFTHAIALELREDGSYASVAFDKGRMARAENIFKAMLTSYGWLQRNGLLPKERKENA